MANSVVTDLILQHPGHPKAASPIGPQSKLDGPFATRQPPISRPSPVPANQGPPPLTAKPHKTANPISSTQLPPLQGAPVNSSPKSRSWFEANPSTLAGPSANGHGAQPLPQGPKSSMPVAPRWVLPYCCIFLPLVPFAWFLVRVFFVK